MLQKATQTNYFAYQKEEVQNPYIGFMSFQHFRGEKLYSDIVVLPENHMTETEHVECYPVPDYVLENGREEGYYPDTSVVYIRSLWKEFEPQRGVYNYQFIEDILKKAKAHNQSLIFRLLPHSTRACDDVPDWLKELIPCPERPEGKRVKDSPTDPLYLELFCQAIRKIGERFDCDPTFDAIDICLPGAWGEGHNLHLYSEESIEKIFDTYTDVFHHTRLMGQISKPEIINRINQKGASIGIRGDGLGEPHHTYQFYPVQMEKVTELWKSAPVSYEAYWWLGEWKRKEWDIDAIISLTLKWHISSFNPKSMPVPSEWKEKVEAWVAKMGYHFAIDYFKFPASATKGDALELILGIDNVGVAPIYKRIPLRIRLVNEKCEYLFDNDVDITTWMPGKDLVRLELPLPADLQADTYDIEIGICDEQHPLICFCTDAKRDGSYYKVGKIKVEE